MTAEHFKSIADGVNYEKDEKTRILAKEEYVRIQREIASAAEIGLYSITVKSDPNLASFLEMLLRSDGFEYDGTILYAGLVMYQYTVTIKWK